MTRFRFLFLWLALASGAVAQREPRIGYVYPAGGQQGTTFDVVIGGQYLNGTTNVYISGAGVRALVLAHEPALTPKQVQELRQRAEELRKKEKDAAARKELFEIRKKLAAFTKMRANPALAETVPVQITIAPRAVPGDRELRVGSPNGLSNPLVFQVGQLPEVQQPEVAPEPEPPPKPARSGNPPPNGTNAAPPVLTLPVTLNGRIMPGEVDRYRFQARRGQQLVVAASARALIPYLADAVPGWFQATLTLYDDRGTELAYDDDYRFHPDPVMRYTIPSDGNYVLAIKDALYRGREDFVYRIAVGELPFLASIFPLGGKAGDQPTVDIRGWNLPVSRLNLSLEGAAPGAQPISVRNKAQLSNELRFRVDTLPECRETEPNKLLKNAQAVTLPVIINGRCDRRGDGDVFAFQGRAGEQIVAEVHARRLNSPLDSVLKLTDASGQQLAFNDDLEDKGSGLNTHHADAYLKVTLPADGLYYLYLWDAQQQGGWAYSYRLRISGPRPDFELRVVPSSLTVRGGASVPLTVYALRKDGFTGEIALALKDAPAGFKLTAAQLPANQDQVKLTLTAPSTASAEPIRLQLEGRATIGDQAVVHLAVPAEDRMQAFAYRHLVPAQDWLVAVVGRPRPPDAAKILSATPVKIPPGGTARVQVSLTAGPLLSKIEYALAEPPEGITIQTVSPQELLLQTDAKLQPGMKGNLIVLASAERLPPPDEQSPQTKPRRVPLGALPAIPFEIVPQPGNPR